jgi:o-succinylbenzoate---CoA ligase
MTNDLVNVVSKTRFEWLGRTDFIINSGGKKIIAEKVEVALSDLLTACNYFVYGIPHNLWGEEMVLFLERKNIIDSLPNAIKLLTSLQNFEKPKRIIYLDEFKKSMTLKVLRKETAVNFKSTLIQTL